MSSVLVLGGAGFLGERLAAVLNDGGLSAVVADLKNVSLHSDSRECDVTDIHSLTALGGFQTIINLAAQHRDDVRPVSEYYRVNVQGARVVCEYADLVDAKTIVFTSSVAVYGFAPPNTDEDGSPNYFNDYGKSKYEAELVYKEWQLQRPNERSLVIIRPTVIFGEGNRGNVYNLMKQVFEGKFLMVGSGENIKSMAYVGNVAAFIRSRLDAGPGCHVHNYVDKPDLNMSELVSLVREETLGRSGVGIRLPRVAGLLLGYLADIASSVLRIRLPLSSIRIKKFTATTQFKSKSNTGFKAPVDVKDALRRTIQYEFTQRADDELNS